MWWCTTALAATWPALAPLPGGADGARDAAVVIGIEDYLAVPDVPGARQNAEDWYAWLSGTRGVPLPKLRMLRDREATRELLLEEVDRAAAAVEPGGTLWVVFVGHGAPALDGRDGVLVGADAQQTARNLYSRSVSRSELEERAGKGAAHQTVLVLDACFSGQVAGEALVPGLQPLIPTWALQSSSATVLVAAGAGEFAGPLPGLDRPAFSYLALGALRGWADADADGVVSADEVQRYTRDALAAVVVDRTQTPERAGPDAVLAKGTERGPDLAAIVRDQPTGPQRPAPTVSAGAADTWLGQIWQLRNTPEGRRRVSGELGTVFPGVGTAGVVVGASKMADLRENPAINPYSNCFAEGDGLRQNRDAEGMRRWPCGELKAKDFVKVDVVYTPSFVAWAHEPGGAVWYLDVPGVEFASLFDHPVPEISTPEGITVGMSLDEALSRVPVPPDSRDDLTVTWNELGLTLLLRGDEVRMIRINAASGRAP